MGIKRTPLSAKQLLLGCLILTALAAGSACKRKQRSRNQTGAGVQQVLPASAIAFGDPQYTPQLLGGFYPIERTWRWTEKSFSVKLVPPGGAAQRGAQLQLRFGIPDTIIQNLKSVTLSAAVEGVPLAPQVFDKPGQFTYTRDVPAERLQASTVTVAFALDHALPPGAVDRRELGIVVSEVGLSAK